MSASRGLKVAPKVLVAATDIQQQVIQELEFVLQMRIISTWSMRSVSRGNSEPIGTES